MHECNCGTTTHQHILCQANADSLVCSHMHMLPPFLVAKIRLLGFVEEVYRN